MCIRDRHDSYLRLAAEYDNYRKRSQKEKDNLYTEIRSEDVYKRQRLARSPSPR